MSTRSDAMRDVVAGLAPDLKAAGFRKRRHCFNRATEPGVVQVVDFQMQPYRIPPGSPVPPALVDGSFRINLGVYVDALAREAWEQRDGKWVNEYDCQIRAVIGELLLDKDHDRRAVEWWSGVTDIWWSLADVDIATDTAGSALRDHALPWLDALVSERAAIQHDRAQRLNAEAHPLPPLPQSLLELDPEERRRRSEHASEVLKRSPWWDGDKAPEA